MVPVGYVETAEFANLGFLTKSLYFSAWVKIILAKYVSAWLLAEGAVILSGLAYNGRWEDGSVKWNGGKVEKILKGSLDSIPSPSPSVKIQNYGRESLLEV